jgi:predicted transcriptional regulator
MEAFVSASDRSQRKNSRPTTISLSHQLHHEVEAIATRKCSTVSQVVREALLRAVEREKRDEEAHADAR